MRRFIPLLHETRVHRGFETSFKALKEDTPRTH